MYMSLYIAEVAQKYSIAEARSALPSIIDQAEAGQEVELTRRGHPVAVVISCRMLERLRGRRRLFGEAYQAFLGTHALRDVGVQRAADVFVRDKTPGRQVDL